MKDLSDVRRSNIEGCAIAFVVLMLMFPAPIAALQVLDIADGSAQMNLLAESGLTFLIWLSVPCVFAVAAILRRRPGVQLLAVGVAIAASVGLTLWIVRPQAPDGSEYDVTYDEAIAELERDVGAALDEVVPGRWDRPADQLDPSRCVDKFDRDRGAVYGGIHFRLDGRLSGAEFERFRAAVSKPGREVQAPAFGVPAELLGPDHDSFVVRVDDPYTTGKWLVEATTPCLRAEGETP